MAHIQKLMRLAFYLTGKNLTAISCSASRIENRCLLNMILGEIVAALELYYCFAAPSIIIIRIPHDFFIGIKIIEKRSHFFLLNSEIDVTVAQIWRLGVLFRQDRIFDVPGNAQLGVIPANASVVLRCVIIVRFI